VKAIPPRPIAPDELAVLEAALLRAPLKPIPPAMASSLSSLNVVGVCECGCRSIYFSPISRKDSRIADGIGRIPDGKRVEVMVWAVGDVVTKLDIVEYESSGALPLADSVTSWEAAGS
jgi:hypothetical protein